MYLYGLELDAWVISLFLIVMMSLAVLAGWWYGRSEIKKLSEERVSINDGIMAIFGLLLGFTFSMSLGKHDQRRDMLLQHSNSIGDFATCADMLPEPHSAQLLLQIKGYLQLLLTPLKDTSDQQAVNERLDILQTMQTDMQKTLKQSIAEKPVVAIPLVNTFNALTSAHAARLASLRDRLPWSVLILLFLSGMVTMMFQGRKLGKAGEKQIIAMFGFILLINLVIWVTLDLNQPGRGWITVSYEPLQRLLAGLSR